MKDYSSVISSEIVSIKPLLGGCIGNSSLVTDINGIKYFVKEYLTQGVSESEALGLDELSSVENIKVPKVINFNKTLLVLEYIEPGNPTKNYFKELGVMIALLHKKKNFSFGLSNDNYIGETPQTNREEATWSDFFIKHRMDFQVNLAVKNGYNRVLDPYEQLKPKIKTIIGESEISPSLIHGDLWNGNILTNKKGDPYLIDPSVSYSHREMDLTLTYMFGGFPTEFYKSYNSVYPLKKGWQDRVKLYTIYHILNHLNIFGTSYLNEALSNMNYFI